MSKAAGVSPETRLDTFVIDSHPISSFDRNSQAKSSSIRYALSLWQAYAADPAHPEIRTLSDTANRQRRVAAGHV